VDEPAQRVRSDESEKPQNEQDDENCPQHFDSLYTLDGLKGHVCSLVHTPKFSPREAFVAQGLAYAAIRRREKATTFRDAGIAQIAACTPAVQMRNPLSTTKATEKKAKLNKVNAARSSRT